MNMSRYPFHVGPYDLRVKDRMKQAYPEWERLVRVRTKDFADFAGFMDTLYLDLWKPSASTLSNPEAGIEALQMLEILEIAHAMPEWRGMKERTQNRASLSTLACMHLGKLIQFPEPPPQNGGGDGTGSEGSSESASAGEPTDQDGNESAKTQSQITASMREAIRQAVSGAAQNVEDGETIQRLWGSELGEDLDGDPERLQALITQMRQSPRLRTVLMLLGRLRNQMRNVRMTKANYIPEEFVDVELGNDITKLMPSARLLLADPELDILFMLKYVQRSLLQQVKHGNTTEARGPIIVMVDTSRSMRDNLGKYPNIGTISRYDWAIGVGLTMALMAATDGRDFHLGLFDTRMGRVLTSRTGILDPKEVAELMAVVPTGGTSFEPPIQKALQLLDETRYKKADLVFITDGECVLSHSWVHEVAKKKTSTGVNVLGIVCGRPVRSLETFCDSVIPVESITDADKSADKLFAL